MISSNSITRKLIRATSALVNGTPPSKLAVASQPSSAVAATNFTVVIQLQNASSVDVTNAGVSVSIAKQSGTGTLSGGATGLSVLTDSNGRATFNTLQMDTGGASVVLRATSSGLTLIDTSTISITAAGTITQFTNSTETGGGGGDSDVLWADDFSTPVATGSPGSWCDVNFDNAGTLYGGPATSGGIPHTRGFGGTIYNQTAYPMLVTSITGRSTPYAASHGTQPSPQGSDWMGDHNFSRGVTEFYTRFDCYFNAGYSFGAEKIWDINPPNWLGNGGIIWGNLHINLGGSPASSATLYWQGTTAPSYSTGFVITSGRWYSIQLYCKRGTGGNDGILKVWADDLGVAGSTIPGGGTPTLRLNRTDYPFNPAQGSYTQFGNIWCESWANAPSSGSWKFTNIMCREFNGGTNGNSPILIRASA